MTKKANNNETKNMNANTRIVCPECGAEFDLLAPHEHTEKNVTVLGMDSGLGTVYLPVNKRADALRKAGIDPSKFFAIPLPTGGSQWMQMQDDGKAVPADVNDPVVRQIIEGGTVPNRNLFRRWIMSQVFRALTERDYRGRVIGIAAWITRHGYEYQWKMLLDELHTQAKLYGKDMENFRARNRWFNKEVAWTMAMDYIKQLKKNAYKQATRNCKGNPYIRVKGFDKGVFVEDIEKKMLTPLRCLALHISSAKTPDKLEKAVKDFWAAAKGKEWSYNQCAAWKDAFRGAGAYFTMQNLLRFHGANFPKDNDFYIRGRQPLDMLETAAATYQDGEGWRLWGLMLQMIKENNIDIEAKRKQWAAEKQARLSRR